MKKFIIFLFLLASQLGNAQTSQKVSIQFTYNGNPLCYWDVTLKHGDVEIAKGKTDQNGTADFGTVRILSRQVDAYGYKKTSNGEKKWDVKGYIVLAESGTTRFDFKGLVEEIGMKSMIESAWGLTLNDCSKGAPSIEKPKTVETPSKPVETKKEEKPIENKEPEEEKMDPMLEDMMSGKSQAEAFQNTKVMLENKIASADKKIKLLNDQLAKKSPDTEEYSELQYDIRKTEIERDLNQVKLDKTNRQIAKGNTFLTKGEKEDLVLREDLLNQEADSLKAAKKSGALYGKTPAVKSNEKAIEKPTEISPEEKTSEKKNEDVEALTIYSDDELSKMSVLTLKKTKIETNGKITNRKMSLKTQKSILKPEKITQFENEIKLLEELLMRIDAEIAKR